MEGARVFGHGHFCFTESKGGGGGGGVDGGRTYGEERGSGLWVLTWLCSGSWQSIERSSSFPYSLPLSSPLLFFLNIFKKTICLLRGCGDTHVAVLGRPVGVIAVL